MKHSKSRSPEKQIENGRRAESHEPPQRTEGDYQRFRDKHRVTQERDRTDQRDEESSSKRPKR